MKLKEKENLVEKIGMQFDEAAELFSDETLLSMSMVSIVGGNNTYCGGAQCVKGCNNNCGCGGSGGTTTSTSTKPGIPWGPIITGTATIISTIIAK